MSSYVSNGHLDNILLLDRDCLSHGCWRRLFAMVSFRSDQQSPVMALKPRVGVNVSIHTRHFHEICKRLWSKARPNLWIEGTQLTLEFMTQLSHLFEIRNQSSFWVTNQCPSVSKWHYRFTSFLIEYFWSFGWNILSTTNRSWGHIKDITSVMWSSSCHLLIHCKSP